MGSEIDVQHFPLVLIRLTGTLADDEFRKYLDDVARLVDRAAPFVTLTDTRRSPPPSARQRRMANELIERERETTQRWLIAMGLVIDHALIRGAISAINWVTKPAVPMETYPEPERVHAWLDERYRERTGAPLPPFPADFFRR